MVSINILIDYANINKKAQKYNSEIPPDITSVLISLNQTL